MKKLHITENNLGNTLLLLFLFPELYQEIINKNNLEQTNIQHKVRITKTIRSLFKLELISSGET